MSLTVRYYAGFKAFAIHLGISALVAVLAAALVFLVWFPYPFREISGGQSLFGLVVAVDVVLGPLLTWVVFDRRKPRSELVRDLAVIGMLQLAALAYGLWSVYLARPVYLVHEVDRFVAISAADVDPADLPKALLEFQRLPFSGVRVIGVRDSKDGTERLRSLELALAGKDVSMQPNYWQPLSDANRAVIRQRAKPLQGLVDRSALDRAAVTRWLAESQRSASEIVYLPVTARAGVWSAMLDAQTLEIVGYVPIDGF